MARFWRDQIRKIGSLLLSIAAMLLACRSAQAQELYDRPVLVIDPDMHTAIALGATADAAGQYIVTGSIDKTVRVWSAADGKLLQTIWMPAGPGKAAHRLGQRGPST